ncbi:hypothetical protein B0H13DRAFT_2306499 [Mycena leptocephala]|nr:hypothetical protein B0H13DRAFT_2306499 [Mycena leptocephala]
MSRVPPPYLARVDLADVGFTILSWTSNGDRCILVDRVMSWEPSVIVEGAWVRMTPSPVALLDSHHYLEPPSRAFAAHSILLLRLPRRQRVPRNAHETHHITRIRFYPQVLKPPPTSRWTLKRCTGRHDTSRR